MSLYHIHFLWQPFDTVAYWLFYYKLGKNNLILCKSSFIVQGRQQFFKHKEEGAAASFYPFTVISALIYYQQHFTAGKFKYVLQTSW